MQLPNLRWSQQKCRNWSSGNLLHVASIIPELFSSYALNRLHSTHIKIWSLSINKKGERIEIQGPGTIMFYMNIDNENSFIIFDCLV